MVALVDQSIALIVVELGQHLEAVRVAGDESSFAEQASLVFEAMLACPLVGGGDTLLPGLAGQRVLDEVVGDRRAAGVSVANVLGDGVIADFLLGRVGYFLVRAGESVLLDVGGGLVVLGVHGGGMLLMGRIQRKEAMGEEQRASGAVEVEGGDVIYLGEAASEGRPEGGASRAHGSCSRLRW